MRRFILPLLLILILIVVAGGWSLAWFYVSDRVEAEIDAALAGSVEDGIAIACEGRTQSGFPFRFVVACTDATARPADGEWAARLAGLRAGAWFYRPRLIEATLQGPFELAAEALGQPATSDWQRAAAELLSGNDGPRRVRASFTSPVAQVAGTEVATDQTTFAISPADGAEGSVVAVEAEQLRLPASEAVPAFDVAFEARTPIPPEALLGGEIDRSAGFSVSGIELSLEAPETQLFAQGDVEVDPEGVVSGSLDLYLVGIENLPELLGALPQQAGSAGNVLVGALLALAAPAEWQGRPARRIEIEIEEGEVRAGALSLGRLPPLWSPPPTS